MMLKQIAFTALLLVTLQDFQSTVVQAAGILRGEAPQDCQKCREITACSLVDDMERGVNLPRRWYGYLSPRASDIEMILAAQEGSICRKYPSCRFVGRGSDLDVWARKGYLDEGTRIIAYCSAGGCTACVPQYESDMFE